MAIGVEPTGSAIDAGLSLFESYPAQASRISSKERKTIKNTAKTLFETSPSEAIAYLTSQDKYTNFRPTSLIAKLRALPVDLSGKFGNLTATTYQDLLNRNPLESELSSIYGTAKELGIKDPSAYQAFLTSRLASTPEGQAKIKNESDIAWESEHGTIARDAEGNLMRGMKRFNPSQAQAIAKAMVG